MSNATEFIKKNIGTIGVGAGGALVGGIVGYAAGSRSSKKRSRKKRGTNNKTSRKRSSLYKRSKTRRGRYTPHTAGKRRDTSRKRIRYTKNGQPYIITSNGRAKFISKKSSRISRKRSGGRY